MTINENILNVPPSVIIILGATGDLTHRKLIPALFSLGTDKLLPAPFSLVGFARRPYEDDVFRQELCESVRKHARRKPVDEPLLQQFVSNSYYVQGAFDDPAGYQNLKRFLDNLDTKAGVALNRVFYLATSPEYFETIVHNLCSGGLLRKFSGGLPKVVIEKPFGRDLASAKVLNKSLLNCMVEEQVYRIDHYLGKETVQNLLVFRFANGIFEPIWNRMYIDHVEISMCESIGVENRAGYFDTAGTLRDIVQNHVLQLLCLVATEPPIAFEAEAVRNEKVKVLRAMRRMTPSQVHECVVRGQYGEGNIDGAHVNAYRNERGVNENSQTETYVAMELYIDNWRWAGVPFFVRAGKRMHKRVTEITIVFRHVPHSLFDSEGIRTIAPNTLSFQIQPNEGASMSIVSKPPGLRVAVQDVRMDFRYGTSFAEEAPEAYERLLLDVMRSDATLFTRNDEIEEAWSVISPILEGWQGANGNVPELFTYTSGGWGPEAADTLISSRVGSKWRQL